MSEPKQNNDELAVTKKLQLSNGIQLPSLAFGTWQLEPRDAKTATVNALRSGFRLVDTARVYGNERAVGDAIEAVSDSINRSDIFICSKLWNTDHRPHNVRRACERSIADLKCGYLDLYLIHWPCCFVHNDAKPLQDWTDEDFFPENAIGASDTDFVPLIDTWRAMEELVIGGLVKSIGVSNFTTAEVDELLNAEGGLRVKPVVNQVECHPGLPQTRLKAEMAARGLQLMAYSPLGIGQLAPEHGILANPEILAIASAAAITPAELLLRWNLQQENCVVTKSTSKARIEAAAKLQWAGLPDNIIAALTAFGAKHGPTRLVNPQTFGSDFGLHFVD